MLADIVLTVLAHFTVLAQLLCARREWAETRCVSYVTLLRFAGWFVFSARCAHMLWLTGDLPISAASLIALTCLSLAEITAAAFHKRT